MLLTILPPGLESAEALAKYWLFVGLLTAKNEMEKQYRILD